MNEEDGMFTGRGYIAYKGYTSLAGDHERRSEQPHSRWEGMRMIIQAELRRKQSEYEGEACVVDKVIELPSPAVSAVQPCTAGGL